MYFFKIKTQYTSDVYKLKYKVNSLKIKNKEKYKIILTNTSDEL